MEKLQQDLICFIEGLGLDTFGFTRCRRFEELEPLFKLRKAEGLENTFEEKDIEKRIDPLSWMKEGKTIISIAFPYLYNKELKGSMFFSKYTHGKDYHLVLDEYLSRICEYINILGGKSIKFVDNNALPERYIAKLCGLGFIGKNSMLITKKYGSYVFLGEIITDLEFSESNTLLNINCGNCNACIANCPTASINHKECNPNICLSYITQEKVLEDQWLLKLDGRIFGCDSCQVVCPHNAKIEYSKIKAFEPKIYMENVEVEELIYMSNEVFKNKYKDRACGWRGKTLIQRNALLNEMIINKSAKIKPEEIKSPFVKEYYNRLLHLMNL